MTPATGTDSPSPFPAPLLGPLRDRGFVPEGRAYRRAGLTIAAAGRWYVLAEPADGSGDWSRFAGLSQPGLWKGVPDGAPDRRVFEIPGWALGDLPEEDGFAGEEAATFAAVLDWALETRCGRVSRAWRPPDAGRVESWLPHGALTVLAHGLVRQGALFLGANRWALRVPILPRLAMDLAAPRWHALQELVRDAQRRWAMVRVGVPADADPAALVAEVDFSGAPPCELLFLAGLDVLRHVVARLAETADVLADPTVEIACQTPGWATTNPHERNIR